MSGSVNKVILVGRLCQDPTTRNTQAGSPVVTLNVATNETWKDKATGERKERAEFHRVVIFNEHLCKVAEQYLRKGSSLYLEGSVQTRKWTDQSGTDKYTTEIILQKFKGELVMLGKAEASDKPDRENYAGVPDLDDMVPF